MSVNIFNCWQRRDNVLIVFIIFVLVTKNNKKKSKNYLIDSSAMVPHFERNVYLAEQRIQRKPISTAKSYSGSLNLKGI